jgi:DNA repair exonuclease SbcCD ATPase subunit
MATQTQEVDILNARSTNINIRISPMLKVKIIEQGAKMGINLSDYINYVITKAMSGNNNFDVEDTPQYQELQEAYETLDAEHEDLSQTISSHEKRYGDLQKQFQIVQSELSKYEAIAQPYKDSVGKPITVAGETYQPKHLAELLGIILKTIKIKN